MTSDATAFACPECHAFTQQPPCSVGVRLQHRCLHDEIRTTDYVPYDPTKHERKPE